MSSGIVANPLLSSPSVLPEHTRVRLRLALPLRQLDAGAVGTIVHVYEAGTSYEVEFTVGLEHPIVETLPSTDVEEVSEEDV